MALDGAFLHHLQKEIWDRAKDARIDKIYQPNRDELVFVLRTRKERMNVLLSARANSARVHFTQVLPENPAQPDSREVPVYAAAQTVYRWAAVAN